MPLFGFPPKENSKELNRSHLFEKLSQEHSEGLGQGLGEGRKDNKGCWNELELNPTQALVRGMRDILSLALWGGARKLGCLFTNSHPHHLEVTVGVCPPAPLGVHRKPSSREMLVSDVRSYQQV